MKRFFVYLFGLLLAFAVVGVWRAGSVPAVTADSLPVAAGAPGDELPQTPESGQPYGNPVSFDRNGLPAAYADAVEVYCRTGVFPDGADAWEIPGSVSYAVCDVDGDGRDELILKNEHAAMAGMVERIYDYDAETQAFRQQFSGFPALTYYENGVILEDWSHNQGLSGDGLWPYNLHQYQPDSDEYLCAASVDGWSKELAEHSPDWGDFPAGIDADGNGFIYFILTGDWSWSNYGRPVDGAEYESWLAAYLDGADKLEISYQTLEIETVYPNAAG